MNSIKAVAQQAQVSIATVSRVINGSKFVSPDVEKRVRDAIAALNYQPNGPARNLRRQSTLSIGILLPQLNDYFFCNLAYELEKTLAAVGYSPLFCSTENDEQTEMVAISNLIRSRVDAVIMVPYLPVNKPVSSLPRLLDQQIPVVVVDRNMPNLAVNQVLTNNEQGGYDGADYLLKLGHRQIGIIDSIANEIHYPGEPGYERMAGIRSALLNYGVRLDADRVVIDKLTYTEMGYHGTLKLLRQSPQVTAIFALTDAVAIGVLRAAYELGLLVPHDLSVMGFDDISLASHVIPRLTTIAQPVEQIAQNATELLLRQIHDPKMLPETIKLDTRLVSRESTAPPREAG
jgi:LacI family transcriptional regulator